MLTAARSRTARGCCSRSRGRWPMRSARGRVGIRLSPVTPANDAYDAEPQPLFEHVVRALAPLGLAYVHVIEGATGGPREIADRPFDYAALKRAYREAGGKGAWMVNNGYDKRARRGGAGRGRRPGGVRPAVHRQPRPRPAPAGEPAAGRGPTRPPSTAAAPRATSTIRRSRGLPGADTGANPPFTRRGMIKYLHLRCPGARFR